MRIKLNKNLTLREVLPGRSTPPDGASGATRPEEFGPWPPSSLTAVAPAVAMKVERTRRANEVLDIAALDPIFQAVKPMTEAEHAVAQAISERAKLVVEQEKANRPIDDGKRQFLIGKMSTDCG